MNKTTPNLCICIVLAAMLTAADRACVAATPAAPAAPGSTPTHPTGAIHITILRDVSPSMHQDDRHKTAGEVLKMAAALLDCRVTIVEFASNAQAASFNVPAKRNELLKVLDRTDLGQGTSYLKGLEKVPSSTTAVVFLSDGEPSESRDDVLACLKRSLTCPVHAVAVAAGADELLRDMAASTGGSFYRARDARSLVDAFLEILSQVASFRRVESPGPPVNLQDVSGKLLCIGINGLPAIDVEGLSAPSHAGQGSQNLIRLPGTDVHVVTEFLTDPRNVSVALGAKNSKQPSHLIVATFGSSKLGLKLQRTESGKVLAKAEFADGKLAGKDTQIASRFTVIGEDGRVEQVVSGKRVGDEFVAELKEPKGPYDVHVETIDAENGRRVSSRAVADSDALPVAPVAQKPPPRREVSSEAQPALFSEGSVDLLIVAHRKTGRVVLAQSGQAFHIDGLSEIDRISLAVVRGSMDPRVFAALGSALQARWLREDGGIERTSLRLQGDRYTTDAVKAGLPGTVTCELTSGLSTSPVTLKAEATFLPVVLQLRDITAHPIPAAAPQGTIIRPEFSIEVQVGNRPATSDELSEILAAEEPKLALSIEDSTGKVRQIAEHKGQESGRINAKFVLQQIGACNVTARLTGQKGGRIWAKLKWPAVRVTPSPLEVLLCRRLEDGSYVPVAAKSSPAWIPGMFCEPLDGLFYAVSLKTDQPTSFYRAYA